MASGPRSPYPPLELLPGVAIGPLRLGMTTAEIQAIFTRFDWRMGQGVLKDGFHVEFHDGRAVRIEVSAETVAISIAGERLTDLSDDHVRTVLSRIVQPGPDWTEAEGLRVFHWEYSDHTVFSFMVYATGYRDWREPAADGR